GIGSNHESWNLTLAKGSVGLQSPLTTNQIVKWAAGFHSARHGNRSLQPKLGNVLDNLLEHLLVAYPGVHHGNAVYRDHFDPLRRQGWHQAALRIGTRAAIR